MSVLGGKWTYMLDGKLCLEHFDTKHDAEYACIIELRGALLAALLRLHRSGNRHTLLRPDDKPDDYGPRARQGRNFMATITTKSGHTFSARTSRRRVLAFIAASEQAGAKVGHSRPIVHEPSGRKRNAEAWTTHIQGAPRSHIISLDCRAPRRKPSPFMTPMPTPEPSAQPWWSDEAPIDFSTIPPDLQNKSK